MLYFEHLQIFPVNENILNANKVFAPRLKITLYMVKTMEIIGFIETSLINKKKNKIKKGHFIKYLFKYDYSINNFIDRKQTPFRLGIMIYREIPNKWENYIDKPFLTDFNIGFLLTI